MVIVSHSSLWGCLRWMSEVTPGIPWEKIGSICRKAAGYICSLGYRVKIRDGRIRQCPKWLVNLTHTQNLRLNFSFSLVNNFQVLAQPPHASLLLKSLIFFSTKLLVQSFNPSFSLCFFFWGGGARNPSTSSPCFSRRASCKSWSLTIQAPHRWRITGCIPAIVWIQPPGAQAPGPVVGGNGWTINQTIPKWSACKHSCGI